MYHCIKQQTYKYKSLIRSPLKYVCSVLDLYSQGEMVQYRVVGFITNRQCNASSVGGMLQHLDWCSLEDRHKDAQLVMMYKRANKK